MSQNISVIIVEKGGSLKSLTIKDYKEEDLYKKCGFKKPDGFSKQTEWGIKLEGKKFVVALFAKTEGKANTENKYDFPPPVDTTLFFGSCVLVSSVKKDDGSFGIVSLSVEQWGKMYEKLFGGFEDLNATCAEDEAEEDELDNIPASKKTKQGYLKDGFVVDSDSDEKDDYESDDSIGDEDETEDSDEQDGQEEALEIEDIGSELSEEEYDSSSEDEQEE
ncbi:MAG: hypothetical protein EBY20_02330 [Alphaproteobacteria bacterium]|uniref:Uncharacterized protein n=1 Tax=viral metagenome TaxID=1070528 RepID=A0A6C0HRY0_9ZZZZ|nr:hypothetical protein [Alphaproteobacteria bacterium]